MNLYGFLLNAPIGHIDAKGLKKCGIVKGSFQVTYSDPKVVELPAGTPKGLTWHMHFTVRFRTDGDYDPRCCEFQQDVGFTIKVKGKADFVRQMSIDGDGYHRGPQGEDYSSTSYWNIDDPYNPFSPGDELDLTWTAVHTVYSPGKSWPANRRKGISQCGCDKDPKVAQLTHTVHISGIFPKPLDWHDSVPKKLVDYYPPTKQ